MTAVAELLIEAQERTGKYDRENDRGMLPKFELVVAVPRKKGHDRRKDRDEHKRTLELLGQDGPCGNLVVRLYQVAARYSQTPGGFGGGKPLRRAAKPGEQRLRGLAPESSVGIIEERSRTALGKNT
jgi:hypothetical protein